jgi:hypothetical protein
MTDLLTIPIRIGGNDGRSDGRTEVSFHLSQSALPVRR